MPRRLQVTGAALAPLRAQRGFAASLCALSSVAALRAQRGFAASLCALASLVLAGCGPISIPRGHVAVDPVTLQLPAAREGAAAAASVALYNIGDAPLVLKSAQLGVTTGYLVDAPLPATLAPGASLSLEVRHWPGRGPRSNSLELESDDLAEPWTRVELLAFAATPSLAVAPAGLEFGAVASGAVAPRSLEVKNLGLGAARGLSLAWLSGSSADFRATLPAADLGPGESLSIEVRYAPRGGDEDRAALELRWQGAATGVTIELRGRQDLVAPD
jgi:hypothetical protein